MCVKVQNWLCECVCAYVKEGVQKGGAQGGCVCGGVPVPFCILNSSTSVQPFSVVAAAGCEFSVYVCMHACVC